LSKPDIACCTKKRREYILPTLLEIKKRRKEAAESRVRTLLEDENTMELQKAPDCNLMTDEPPLTDIEKKRLADCEAVIERNIVGFREIGAALREIKDAKLYRKDYKTFAEYCQERWNLGYRRAHQFIEASGIAENLNDRSHSEYTLRALAGLTHEQQKEVFQKALGEAKEGNRKLTHVCLEELREMLVTHCEAYQAEKEEEKKERAIQRQKNKLARDAFYKRKGAYDTKYYADKWKPIALFSLLKRFEGKETDTVKGIIRELKRFMMHPNDVMIGFSIDKEATGANYSTLLNQKFIKNFVNSPFMNELIFMLKLLGIQVQYPNKEREEAEEATYQQTIIEEDRRKDLLLLDDKRKQYQKIPVTSNDKRKQYQKIPVT
jgi:hypothetical protein